MNKSQPVDLSASTRQRLLNVRRARGEDFNLTLTRYGIERLLYRLSQSGHADRYVLKDYCVYPCSCTTRIGWSDGSAGERSRVRRAEWSQER